MSTVEVYTTNGVKKYEYFDEDIDTIIVSSDDIDLTKEGFLLKYYDTEKKCKVVHKMDVIAHYRNWVEKHSYFGGMPCSCEDIEGGVRVIMYCKPTEYGEEFVCESYYIDRGDEFPPIPSERYYKDVFVDDERLQRDVVCEKHTDYSVDAHGITTNMEEARRTEFTVKYLREKLIERYNFEAIALLLYGNYGYRIPDKLYATNIDLVFEEVIPYAYERCKERGPYAGSNFLRTLCQAIVNGYWSREVLSKAWIEDGQVVHPDNNYLFWMNIRIHLKLAEVHKTNREPYNLLDLSNVSYWLEKSYDQYLYKHDKVFWHGNVVCEDIGEFVKSALKDLEYFKRFHV